jgi:hypothetical protein
MLMVMTRTRKKRSTVWRRRNEHYSGDLELGMRDLERAKRMGSVFWTLCQMGFKKV